MQTVSTHMHNERARVALFLLLPLVSSFALNAKPDIAPDAFGVYSYDYDQSVRDTSFCRNGLRLERLSATLATQMTTLREQILQLRYNPQSMHHDLVANCMTEARTGRVSPLHYALQSPLMQFVHSYSRLHHGLLTTMREQRLVCACLGIQGEPACQNDASMDNVALGILATQSNYKQFTSLLDSCDVARPTAPPVAQVSRQFQLPDADAYGHA